MTRLKQLFLTGNGRVAAAAILFCVLGLGAYSDRRSSSNDLEPNPLLQLLDIAATPFRAGQEFMFDSYQRTFPRHANSRPVTVVAIDEASLTRIGQWPWPRDRLAGLVDAIAVHHPAALGLNIYMPEVDQTSPSRIAASLSVEHALLADALDRLPSHEIRLAQAITSAPTVLSAAGFRFPALSTTTGLKSAPWSVSGSGTTSNLAPFPAVLASLPELQAAASGQGLVSMEDGSVVRRIPLAYLVGQQIVSSFAMEILRVASGARANTVSSDVHGVRSVQVAELKVPTQRNGQIWMHFSPLRQGIHRYVSAVDVLEGKVSGQALERKLVLIGLTGAGLSDRWHTPLGETIPGIEVQAQLLESMLDGRFLLRPWWMLWAESTALLVLGSLLIWAVPRSAGSPAPVLKLAPKTPIVAVAGISFLALAFGFFLFSSKGWLFNGASLILGLSTVLASLIYSVMMLVYRQTRQMELALIESLKRSEKELEEKVRQRTAELREEQARTKELLYNILPIELAEELSETGSARPAKHESVSVLFTDFSGFTQVVSGTSADRIVAELNDIFAAFDDITDDCGVEKIKTIGDAYMAAAGLPLPCIDHAQRCVRAGLRMVEFLELRNQSAAFKWSIRIGIHSGAVVAGVVGKRKYAYDIWGDTVNVASRMESSGEVGRVNISGPAYDLIKDDFECIYRGKVSAKGKGEVDMYFVKGARQG